MKKITWLIVILAIALSGIAIVLKAKNLLTFGELSGLVGQGLVIIGSVLVFYQMKINFNYNQRKATSDFIFGPIQTTLLPLELRLKELIDKQILLFSSNENFLTVIDAKEMDESKKKELIQIVHHILNFYERMSICILKDTFDEDICYDDKGLLMIHFIDWTRTYIRRLETDVEDRAYANSVKIADSWTRRYKSHEKKIHNARDKEREIKTIRNKGIA